VQARPVQALLALVLPVLVLRVQALQA
jgi:hypothetical protein